MSQNMEPEFPKEWHLLAQESHLIQALLADGLTNLRRANLDSKGLFYASFYNISIALERLMKVIVIIGYMSANELTGPTGGMLKRYHHDLKKLIHECRSLANTHDVSCDLEFAGIKEEMIDFLDRYSRAQRYFNLDALSGAAQSRDPLEEWSEILFKILDTEANPRTVRRIFDESTDMLEMLEDSLIVTFHDLAQNRLSHYGYFVLPQLIRLATPRACWHLIQIVRELNKVQFTIARAIDAKSQKMGLENPIVPCFEEFYYFLEGGRARHLRKAQWP